MKRREWIFFGLCAAAYVAARGPAALVGPFILPFENAFQEAIALHHLGHFWDNRFLPVFARIDGVNFYHTAHPPLLHLLYAALYSIFGTAEWVTRAAALTLYLASVALWRRTGADAGEPGWPLYPLALFLPIPFVLATTTNYEPLSIFFVSLIFYLAESGVRGLDRALPRPGLTGCDSGTAGVEPPVSQSAVKPAHSRLPWSLIGVLALGMLADWPVYLAVPALLVRHWREKQRRNLYLGLIAFEAVFLAALLGYMYLVAGEVALFGHAAQRANPVGLFSPALWRELGSHWLELSGAAATIVSVAAVLTVFRRSFSGGRDQPTRAFELFAIFTVILVLAAPQLVSRHHVYLLYFAPPVALALKDLILRVDQKKLAVLALVVLFASPNYIVRYQRNPAYWAMAERVKGKGIKTAFASAAIGAWYYYAGIETVFPMSVAAAKWELDNRPSLYDLDTKSPEVFDILKRREMVAIGAYFRVFSLTNEVILVPVENMRMFSEWFDYERFVYFKGDSFGGIPQHPIQGETVFNLFDDYLERTLSFRPAIIHVLPRVKSDGVQFLMWQDRPGQSLKYSRFVPDRVMVDRVTVFLGEPSGVRLATTPGPFNNDAFDDAWWIEPSLQKFGFTDEIKKRIQKGSPEIWQREMEWDKAQSERKLK